MTDRVIGKSHFTAEDTEGHRETPELTTYTYEQFVTHVRSALHYLYDPVHLRNSPLVEPLHLAAEFDRAAALQRALSEAIRSMKPPADEPPQSRAWRIYDTLTMLHLRQLEREAVALQLGVSERQLRREQRVALEVLAQRLWSQTDQSAPTAHETHEQRAAPPEIQPNATLNEELLWLGNPATAQRLPLGDALRTVQSLIHPLAQQWRVPLQIELQPDLAEVAVAPLALRSILLTILSVVIPRAATAPVVISAVRCGGEIEFTVTCASHSPVDAPQQEKDVASLHTAQNLAAYYNARLSCAPQQSPGFVATLTLPVQEQIPVLVIDDNADWIDLLQRYTVGSPYQLTGTREPRLAPSLAEKLRPSLILLDIMMHNVDGWEVLSELRHTPAIAHIPVVVCTILPVGELARSLGANAFLQKPATQRQFLKILNEQSLPAK